MSSEVKAMGRVASFAVFETRGAKEFNSPIPFLLPSRDSSEARNLLFW